MWPWSDAVSDGVAEMLPCFAERGTVIGRLASRLADGVALLDVLGLMWWAASYSALGDVGCAAAWVNTQLVDRHRVTPQLDCVKKDLATGEGSGPNP